MADNEKFSTVIELDVTTEEFESRLKRIADLTNTALDAVEKFQKETKTLGDGASSS